MSKAKIIKMAKFAVGVLTVIAVVNQAKALSDIKQRVYGGNS